MGAFSIYCALCAGTLSCDWVTAGSALAKALKRRDRRVQRKREAAKSGERFESSDEEDEEEEHVEEQNNEDEDEDLDIYAENFGYDPRLVEGGGEALAWLEDVVAFGYQPSRARYSDCFFP